jgi:hypothetical protein
VRRGIASTTNPRPVLPAEAVTAWADMRIRQVRIRLVGERAGGAGERSLGNEQRTANRRESLEKTIAKILHRYCNFGWANYYIPGEKFPSLIEELVEIASPAGQAGYEEIVHFFLRTQRMASAQERAAKLMEEFGVYRKG